MLKLISFKIHWSAKKVLNIFIIWTVIWLVILFWKLELLGNRSEKISVYRIFTHGCKIKDSISKIRNSFLWLTTPYLYVPGCPSREFAVTDRSIRVHHMLENDNCSITPFKRLTDNENVYGISREISHQQVSSIQSGLADFFRFECFNNSEVILKDYGFLAPSNELKSMYKSLRSSKARFSVLLLGLDKVTHGDAEIQLKQTVRFLKEQPNFLDFKGFNGLGTNATTNMLAILTGLIKLLPTDQNGSTCLNALDFVWKFYSANKYYTVFAENSFENSLFNSSSWHFKEQPTDYYLRPFLLEIANDSAFIPKPKIVSPEQATEPYVHEPYYRYKMPHLEEKCKGSRHEQHIVLELMEQLLPFYADRLAFSFYWFSKNNAFLPHDDEKIKTVLKKYKKSGIFKRTFVFIVSTVHNLKWNSTTEEHWSKQPILYALVPKDFINNYPMPYKHLQANTQRLTTPHDLHATLFALTGTSSSEIKLQLPGTSLLSETLFESRNCQDAHIPFSYCLCKDYFDDLK